MINQISRALGNSATFFLRQRVNVYLLQLIYVRQKHDIKKKREEKKNCSKIGCPSRLPRIHKGFSSLRISRCFVQWTVCIIALLCLVYTRWMDEKKSGLLGCPSVTWNTLKRFQGPLHLFLFIHIYIYQIGTVTRGVTPKPF